MITLKELKELNDKTESFREEYVKQTAELNNKLSLINAEYDKAEAEFLEEYIGYVYGDLFISNNIIYQIRGIHYDFTINQIQCFAEECTYCKGLIINIPKYLWVNENILRKAKKITFEEYLKIHNEKNR